MAEAGMKSLEQQEACPHDRTTEVYMYIFKCNNCGAVIDEADEQQVAKRKEVGEQAKVRQERKAQRQEYFKRRNRRR